MFSEVVKYVTNIVYGAQSLKKMYFSLSAITFSTDFQNALTDGKAMKFVTRYI